MAERRAIPVYLSLEEAAECHVGLGQDHPALDRRRHPPGLPLRQAGHPDQARGPGGRASADPLRAVVTCHSGTLTGQSEEAEDLRQNSPSPACSARSSASRRWRPSAATGSPRVTSRDRRRTWQTVTRQIAHQHQEVTMTSNPHADPPAEWASDKVDLDELLKGVQAVLGRRRVRDSRLLRDRSGARRVRRLVPR